MTVTLTILLRSRLSNLDAAPGKGFKLFGEIFVSDRTSRSRVPAQRILRFGGTWREKVLPPIGHKIICGRLIEKNVMCVGEVGIRT